VKSLITQKIFIDGLAGKLETILTEPASTPRGIAVIAHPHPLYGGTMDNKVVYTLFNSLLELGFITVKFNFRGIGKSEGTYDNGIGEVEDVISVIETIRGQFNNQFSTLPTLLAGFSFGGAIQLRVAERLNPEYLLLIAPSVAHLQAPAVPQHTKFALIIHGDRDEVVLLETVLDWAAPASQPIVVIPGTDHFFHGKLTILRHTIITSFTSPLD